MRFLADESIPKALVEALQEQGEDVLWLSTLQPGYPDHKISDLTQTEQRMLLTCDQDSGEFVYRQGLGVNGVIVLQFQFRSPQQVSETGIEAITNRHDWAGHFSVIEGDRVRMRQLTPLAVLPEPETEFQAQSKSQSNPLSRSRKSGSDSSTQPKATKPKSLPKSAKKAPKSR